MDTGGGMFPTSPNDVGEVDAGFDVMSVGGLVAFGQFLYMSTMMMPNMVKEIVEDPHDMAVSFKMPKMPTAEAVDAPGTGVPENVITGTEEPYVESPQWMRDWIPGQVAWDNAQTNFARGNYLAATINTVHTTAEIVLAAVTLGQFSAMATAGKVTVSAAKPVGRVFWSGKGAERIATEFAKANNMTTIGMTKASQNLAKITEGMPWSKAKPFWGKLSRSFARGARDKAHVFQSAQGVALDSIMP